MSPYNNRDLISMTKEITIALLNGGNVADKFQLDDYIPHVMQSVYDKLVELNKQGD